MHIKSVGAALALAMLSTTAFAADLPARRAPPVFAPVPPVFSWTGGYIGGQIGYEFGKDDAFARATATGVGVGSNGARPDGVVGGGHIGYNFSTQSLPLLGNTFGGVFNTVLGTGGVIGIEGDVDGSGSRQNYFIGRIATNYHENVQGSIRGRLGIAVNRVLFYATGGVAIAGLSNTYTNTIVGGTDVFNRTRVGYTVGGGIEYAFEGNFSVRAEYRYTDFGSSTTTLGASTAGGVSVRQRDTDQRVQLGFSYKFDTPVVATPVVARY